MEYVQTNGVAVSGTGDTSVGDEHSDNSHKKVKVSESSVDCVAFLL